MRLFVIRKFSSARLDMPGCAALIVLILSLSTVQAAAQQAAAPATIGADIDVPFHSCTVGE